jgi:hypothetical protein
MFLKKKIDFLLPIRLLIKKQDHLPYLVQIVSAFCYLLISHHLWIFLPILYKPLWKYFYFLKFYHSCFVYTLFKRYLFRVFFKQNCYNLFFPNTVAHTRNCFRRPCMTTTLQWMLETLFSSFSSACLKHIGNKFCCLLYLCAYLLFLKAKQIGSAKSFRYSLSPRKFWPIPKTNLLATTHLRVYLWIC